MSLPLLFADIAKALNGPLPIEREAQDALLNHAPQAYSAHASVDLPNEFRDVMEMADAHPACETLLSTPLPWAPPRISNDPDYVRASASKLHVELIGPDGLVRSKSIRVGVYGIMPNVEYGMRKHGAEEVFVMLAGCADWRSGHDNFVSLGPGARAHHLSMEPHATRTRDQAFMSIYVWLGDVSSDSFVYKETSSLSS